MGSCGSTSIFRQKEMIDLHDTVYPFMVHHRFIVLSEMAVNECSNSSIPISGPLISDLPDEREISGILLKS